MSFSKLACAIPVSPTLALNEEARLLREKGEPVINLGIGEPRNKAPLNAILSSATKLSGGDVKYVPTDGTPSLKKAIVRYMEDYYGRSVAAYNVIVSDGAKQALWNTLYTLCNPQDEVMIFAPYWVSYPEMIRMIGAIPVVVTSEDGTFFPRFDEVERMITANTKAIIINSPNNPSGVIYPEELVAQVVELCEGRGIYLICDDIYNRLVFDGKAAIPAYKYTQKNIENSKVLVINGVAKLYGMTGFRIGWVVGPKKMVEVITNVQSQTTTCVSPVMQSAAEGALTGMQSIVEALRITIQNNRDVLMQELQSFADISCVRPSGTFYALPDFRAYIRKSIANSSSELSRFLLKKALVVTVPGKEFGIENHLRLSYSGSIKDITEGIERIKWALDSNSPSEIYIGDRKYIRDWE